MSAGNHAQGVAYHASRLGIPATIVLPEFAPFSKVERTKSFGARVVLTGETLAASAQAAREIAAKESLTFVHQIGRASCRERVCQYVEILVVPVTLKKKKNKK